MSKRKQVLRGQVVANRPLDSISSGLGRPGSGQGQSDEGGGEDACPCDGATTLIIEGDGPPACEWGSDECPANTTEPPDDEPPSCPTDGKPIGIVGRSGSKVGRIEFSAPRANLAKRLLSELTDQG